MTEPTGARMQHDVGADCKVPLPVFSGRDDDWPVWSARFGACAELTGWTGVLGLAEAQTAPISVVGASPEAIRLGKIICAVLSLRPYLGWRLQDKTSRPSAPQSACLQSKGGDVDMLPDVSSCLPDRMVDLVFDPMHTRRFCLIP